MGKYEAQKNYIHHNINSFDIEMELYPMLHWDQIEILQKWELMDVLIPSLDTGLVFQKQSNWVCVVNTGSLCQGKRLVMQILSYSLISNMSKGFSIHS